MIYHRMLGFTTSTPRTSRFQSVLWACMALSLLLSPVRGQGNATIEFESVSGTVLTLGDTARFRIKIDTHEEDIYGFSVYLSIPDMVFAPVFTPSQEPFIPGTWIKEAPSVNDTHEDTLGQDTDDIPGIQYNYSQFKANTTVRGVGYAAEFELVPIAIPDNPTGTVTLRFDRTAWNSRETIYLWQSPYNTAVGKEFKTYPPLDLQIAGAKIFPAIPDTNLLPTATWVVPLDNHLISSIYLPNEVVWNYTVNNPPLPTGVSMNLTGPTPWELTVATTSASHGLLDLTIDLAATGELEGDFFDTARVLITVDYPPVFTAPLPAQPFTYDEDDSLNLASSDIFTDDDDPGADISVWLEPGSPIRVNYDGGAGTIAFSADTNYFSVEPYDSARLFIADALGLSADTLLTFTVNSVNDTPVVNLDSVSALGDTLVIYRATPDTLDLSLFVTDVDDAVLSWSVSNPDPTNLPTAAIWSVNRLRLLAADIANFVDIDLILTASDAFGASASDTLVVSIRSWPPVIGPLPNVRVLAGIPDTLWLDPLVSDNDTPDALMTWSFQVVDFVTGLPDPQVSYTYYQASQIVIFNTLTGYAATDLLILTVQDDDNNVDVDTTHLTIFDSYAPMIFPLPGLKIYRDSAFAGILDLDDYVADLQDDPEDISWTFTGGGSLESFYIDPFSHEVNISTNPTFIGNLIVSLVATNSRGLRDTSDLAILVSRLVDGPPLWYAVPDEVEVVYSWTTDLFTYGQVCYDETPTDQIIFTRYYNSDSLTVDIASPNSVKLRVPPAREYDEYTTQLYFSAEDEFSQTSTSGTITVHVKDSFSPVWQRIPTISVNVGGTSSGLFLWDYVSDRDTPDNLLTIEVVNDNPFITESYNSVTSELAVSARVRTGTSRLSITATDDKGNTASTSVNVVVFAVADYTPPEGGLTYFFNPVADRWIHYVVTVDSSTDISRFTWHYAYGSPPRDWSGHLSFVMKDTLPGTVTWIAPYHFQNEGSYALSVEITDAANNMVDPSPSLLFSVGFSKAIGGVLASPDQQLTVSYPPAPIPNGKLLIISEDTLPDSAGQPTAEIAKARANEEAASLMPATVYALDTNLPEPILVTLTYHQNRDTDPYYSFYELDGDQLRKIETYTGADGQFEAAVTLGRDVIFAPSDTPARNAPLPGAELFCYPNPFNATIQVRFLLRWPDRGRIVIYNLLGREVYASPRQPLEAGVHAFSWHSIDSWGLPAPSGVYFIRLETDGGKLVTRKVTLLK